MIDALFQTIVARLGADPKTSYTASLFTKGRQTIAQKIGEEGVELALAAVSGDRGAILAESADVLYHMCVLWADAGISPADVGAVLTQRQQQSGLIEKATRTPA